MKWLRRVYLLLLTLCPSLALAETIKVAVAANFAGAMKELVAEFEKASGHSVALSFASTGKFYAQILNGAPYHAFFSADQVTTEKLEQHKKALADSRFTYAIGVLALWSAKADLSESPLQVLTSGRFNKLALANPRLAPYGAAAEEALDKLGLQGENIAQTLQFVATQNADLGFAALSQMLEQGTKSGSYWRVPDDFHAPIRQDAQILAHGKDSAATHQLMTYLRSAEAQSIIQKHGYKVPGL